MLMLLPQYLHQQSLPPPVILIVPSVQVRCKCAMRRAWAADETFVHQVAEYDVLELGGEENGCQ